MATADPFAQPILRDAFLIIGAAGLIIPAFHRLKLSPVLGFILVGAVVGPHGLGALRADYPWLAPFTIGEVNAISAVAEIGVALLLFTIGLELSFERLRAMRKLVLGLGTAQFALSAMLIAALLVAAGQSAQTAIVLGAALALSSTAIVLNILSSEHRLLSRVGRTAFAMLIFQDLALAPVLFLFSAAAPGADGGWAGALRQIALGAGAVGLILLAGRLLLRPLLRQAARTRGSELFLSTCLVIVIGASAITAAAGLSMLVGALLAGLLIAETEYHRQVHVAVEPFQGLLLGVFLISIGMNLDLAFLVNRPLFVLAAVLALLAVKTFALGVVLRFAGRGWGETVHAATLMAPSSETSMILISAALGARLISPETGGIALLVTALTLTMLPFLARVGQHAEQQAPAQAPPPEPQPERPVIVLGYGRVGQLTCAMLSEHKIPWRALDGDPDVVEEASSAGQPVELGDGERIGLLERIEAGTARALVVTIDDTEIAEHIVAEARARWPELIIIARARDAGSAARLYGAGASDAVPETVESSLQLSEAVLMDIGCKAGPVIASVHAKREEIRQDIRKMLPGDAPAPTLGRRRATVRGAAPADEG